MLFVAKYYLAGSEVVLGRRLRRNWTVVICLRLKIVRSRKHLPRTFGGSKTSGGAVESASRSDTSKYYLTTG